MAAAGGDFLNPEWGLRAMACRAYDPSMVSAAPFKFSHSSPTPALFGPVLPSKVFADDFGKYSWRPDGLKIGMVREMIRDLPTNCNLAAWPTFVLPHRGGLPYVMEDGKLPMSNGSLTQSFRMIMKQDARQQLAKQDPKAMQVLREFAASGFTTKWMEFETFAQYQAYMDGAHQHLSRHIGSHIVETVLIFLSIGNATDFCAAYGDELGKDRLVKVRMVANGVDPGALKAISELRNKSECCIANLFKESWLLAPAFRNASSEVQRATVDRAIDVVKTTPVNRQKLPPKAGFCNMTETKFSELSSSLTGAEEYFRHLRVQYGPVWSAVPSAAHLEKRVFEQGDQNLIRSFAAHAALTAKGVVHDVADDCAEIKLVVEALVQEQMRLQKMAVASSSGETAEVADAAVVVADAAVDAADGAAAPAVDAADTEGMRVAEPAPAAAEPTTAPAGDVAQASIHECKLREALGMVAPDGPRDARAESIASIIRSAKFRINNNLVLCESAEVASAEVRQGLQEKDSVLFFGTAPSRRRHAYQAFGGFGTLNFSKDYGALKSAGPNDYIFILCGADPSAVPATFAGLNNAFEALASWSWYPLKSTALPFTTIQGLATAEDYTDQAVVFEFALVGWGPAAVPVRFLRGECRDSSTTGLGTHPPRETGANTAHRRPPETSQVPARIPTSGRR